MYTTFILDVNDEARDGLGILFSVLLQHLYIYIYIERRKWYGWYSFKDAGRCPLTYTQTHVSEGGRGEEAEERRREISKRAALQNVTKCYQDDQQTYVYKKKN